MTRSRKPPTVEDLRKARIRARAYRAANLEKVRAACRERSQRPEVKEARRVFERAKRYGLSVAAYQALWDKQQGLCAICLTDLGQLPQRSVNVDHDHLTGCVRGILCYHCNVGLGHFDDNPKLLENAKSYLFRSL